MTAAKQTVYGRFQAYISDATGAASIFTDLAGALNTENIPPRNVILFDIVNKIVVFHK